MDLKKILANINNFEDFKIAKSKFFSKNPIITQLKHELKSAAPEQKGNIGRKINEVLQLGKQQFEKKAQELKIAIINQKIKDEYINVDKMAESTASLHPLTKISNRLTTWFIANGYRQKFVKEVETDEYNFEKLNIPKDHPAREMQDSLYINEKLLLRTHNTGSTIRGMLEDAPNPTAIFTIGKVYRNDDDDETHSHQFTQCDLVCVGDVSIGNLIWTLKSLLSYVFEKELKIRLRPSYFPFTEPSMEVDIFYNGKWIEVLGSGMLHPNVLRSGNYDPNKVQAFAAGIGVERLAMIKYDIKHIKEFFKNDLRFNEQFKGVF